MPDVRKEHPLPWSVYDQKLRPHMSTKIVEIHDALGEAVIPWGGFDSIDSHAKRLRIAREIVASVNAT